MTKFPDLIGIRERKYFDHTATLNRGIGDIMRYSALVSYADISDFGPHRILTDEQRKIPSRARDELLYALALYIESLQAPPNPNHIDDQAAAGKNSSKSRAAPDATRPRSTPITS